MAFLLPWIEIILGIFLVVGIKIREVSFIISNLLIIFIIALIIRNINGGQGDCGCFSIKNNYSSNIIALIGKDIGLLILCFMLLYKTKKTKKPIFSIT
jgi:uncharacterized membrane protein YphA (DoxX/SURF4 family)